VITGINLNKKFKTKKVIDGLDIHVPDHSIFGLLGENGCGKTTLLRILLGFASVDGGSFLVNRSADPTIIRLNTGILWDEMGFDPDQTGEQNLKITACIKEIDKEIWMDLAGKFGIAKDLKRRVEDYSLGMKRKLGLVSVFMKEYPLYIFDEPTNGLDYTQQSLFWDMVKTKNKQGSTIMVTSHILPDIENNCSHVGFMANGKIQFSGSIEETLAQHNSLSNLFSPIN